MATAWIYLIAAGLTEILWASTLKRTEGFTRLGPSLFTAAIMALSFFLLSRALKDLPMGTAYAVWTSIGAAGTVMVGIFFAGESASPIRLACLFLILLGTAGLKVAG
jgi:quaternary ammonium compound-resistance protein SugE